MLENVRRLLHDIRHTKQIVADHDTREIIKNSKTARTRQREITSLTKGRKACFRWPLKIDLDGNFVFLAGPLPFWIRDAISRKQIEQNDFSVNEEDAVDLFLKGGALKVCQFRVLPNGFAEFERTFARRKRIQ